MSWKTRLIDVAVGLIVNSDQQILIAKRPSEAPHGGLWEFPGGKIEAGEDHYQALCRELQEEVGIIVQQAEPFVDFQYQYDSGAVHLYFWRVLSYQGQPHGKEGQTVRWVAIDELPQFKFPAANCTAITALVAAMQ